MTKIPCSAWYGCSQSSRQLWVVGNIKDSRGSSEGLSKTAQRWVSIVTTCAWPKGGRGVGIHTYHLFLTIGCLQHEPNVPDVFHWILSDFNQKPKPTWQEKEDLVGDASLIVVAGR